MRFIKKSAVALAALTLFGAMPALAAPNDYVRMPAVEYGEREIDFKSGTQKNRGGGSESANSIGFGWGATPWWFTELYSKYKRDPGASNAFDAWEWENRFQLTETGKYPIDAGFLLEIERPKDRSEGYELTYGPLFQKEWGDIQGNFNVLFQRHVRATAVFDTELLYQAQVKYRASEKLEWGAQAFGNVGRWDHWNTSSTQELKIGPAFFGKIKTGPRQAIKWNAALLHGATNVSPTTTFRFQAEYEF